MEILEKSVSVEDWFIDIRCGICETLLRVKFADLRYSAIVLAHGKYECICIACSKQIGIEQKEIPRIIQCKVADREKNKELEKKNNKDRLNSTKKARIILFYTLFVIKYFTVLTLYKCGIISYGVINGIMLVVTLLFVAILSGTVPMLLNDEPGTFPFGPSC